eukprot:TRINITY_DN11143_c2_g1_i1.p1 TRINITY_DN11143_c2_g1~~TRINITY_DN11143_c2_g1_i1.p1  ORF type:complete len:384 (+),score=67.40 TRINITY_DN11143_c2_g1_i1:73-1224(+)
MDLSYPRMSGLISPTRGSVVPIVRDISSPPFPYEEEGVEEEAREESCQGTKEGAAEEEERSPTPPADASSAIVAVEGGLWELRQSVEELKYSVDSLKREVSPKRKTASPRRPASPSHGQVRTPTPTQKKVNLSKTLRAFKTLTDTEYDRLFSVTNPPNHVWPVIKPAMLLIGLVKRPRDPTELYKSSKAWQSAWRTFRRLPRGLVEKRLSEVAPEDLLTDRLARSMLKEMVFNEDEMKMVSYAAYYIGEWGLALLEACPDKAREGSTPDDLEARAKRIISQTKDTPEPPYTPIPYTSKPRDTPAPPSLPPSGTPHHPTPIIVRSLEEWLTALNLSQYIPSFHTAEVFDLTTASILTDDDLVQMKIPIGPKRKLLTAIQQLRGQ